LGTAAAVLGTVAERCMVGEVLRVTARVRWLSAEEGVLGRAEEGALVRCSMLRSEAETTLKPWLQLDGRTSLEVLTVQPVFLMIELPRGRAGSNE